MAKMNKKGFTIVELLVAMAVFAVLLLIVSIAILQFTRVYYRGVTENRTQNTAREIIDQISQSIQFSGSSVKPTTAGGTFFCAGGRQFTYVLSKQVTDSVPSGTQTYHGLVARERADCATATSGSVMTTPTTDGKDLIGPKMRLARLEVSETGDSGSNLYKIRVKIVYGDDDLLFNPATPDAACKPDVGSQYCAVSDITTIVTKRL